jgi:hypothetical protein
VLKYSMLLWKVLMYLTSSDSSRAKDPEVLHSGGRLETFVCLLSKRSVHQYQISGGCQKLEFFNLCLITKSQGGWFKELSLTELKTCVTKIYARPPQTTRLYFTPSAFLLYVCLAVSCTVPFSRM